VVDHTTVILKPDSTSMSEVAGLGIAGTTALELIKAANLKSGDSVLVNGAGGGIGHLAVQMCREKVGSARKIVVICSKRGASWVEELDLNDGRRGDLRGVRSTHSTHFQIIDREREPLIPYLTTSFGDTPFDAIIDAVGIQDVFNASPAFLAEGKPYVTVGPKAYNYTYVGMLGTIGTIAKNICWPRLLGGTPRPYVQVTAVSNLEALQELADMVRKRKLSVHVGMVVGWDDVQS